MGGKTHSLWKRLAGVFTRHGCSAQSQNRPEKSHTVRGRVRRIMVSIPHYFRELARIRRPRELYGWVYFKFPNSFPIMEFPTCVSVEPTNKCNFSCNHCRRTTMNRPLGSMEVELFEKIVHEVSVHRSVRELKLVGSGEPAIHPRFRELMALLAHQGIPTVVYTNGSLLQLYPHREVLGWGLETVVVSVDGLDAPSHERFKLGSNYVSLRKAIMDFYKYRKSSRRRSPVIEIRHLMVPNETVAQLLQFRRTWMGCADTVSFDYLEPAAGLLEIEDPSRPRCRVVRRELGIQWDGAVPLCSGYHHDYLGNVRYSTISELWRHSRLEYLRQCHMLRDFAQVPVCLRCRKTP